MIEILRCMLKGKRTLEIVKYYEHQNNHKQTPKSTDTAWERIEK